MHFSHTWHTCAMDMGRFGLAPMIQVVCGVGSSRASIQDIPDELSEWVCDGVENHNIGSMQARVETCANINMGWGGLA